MVSATAGPSAQAQGRPVDKSDTDSSKSAAPPPPERSAPAMTAVAAAIERNLAATKGRALVVASALVSDAKPRKPDALVAAIAAQVAGKRGGQWATAAQPAPLSEAREMARNHRLLVHLVIEIAGGQLRVTADVYPVPGTVWSRIRDPEPGPVAHAFAQAPLDAEVRSYLEPVPIAAISVTRAQNFESGVLAIDCDDVDGDGAPEILSVSRRRVTLLRLRGGKVSVIASRPWSELSPVHSAPMREPIGFATVVRAPVGSTHGEASVFVASTDRAKSAWLNPRLEIVDSFTRLAIPDGDAVKCAGLIQMTVTGPVVACADGHPPPLTKTVGGRYDAFDSARLVNPSGEAFVVWVGREDGKIEVRDDGGGLVTLASAGAQLAVGDLDQDGLPEVLSGMDVMDPLRDGVLVRTVAGDGKKPKEIFRLPAGAGVRALSACPPDGPGRAPFVVATADQIWVVR